MTHRSILVITLMAFMTTFACAQSDSSFTYQGSLQESGAPANGSFDFTFTLWDAAAAGNQFGGTVTMNGLAVTAGLFDVELDFGASALGTGGRWLEISVGGSTLSPRTQITSSPYSVHTRGIYVSSGNRVGMGTELPISLLHLKNQTPSASFPDRMLTLDSHDDPNNFDLNSGSGSGILFRVPYQSGSRNGAAIDAVRTTPTEVDSSTALVFSTSGNTSSLSEAMRIDDTGTVRLQDKLVFGNVTSLFAQMTIPDMGSAFAIDAASSNSVLPTLFARNSGSGPVLWAAGANDVSLSGGGLVLIGDQAGANLTMDRNEIMARNNGAPSGLFLNFEGGEVAMGENRIHPAHAYGKVDFSGAITSGSSNVLSSSRPSLGTYEIIVEGGISENDIVIATCTLGVYSAGGVGNNSTGVLRITVHDVDGGGETNKPFQFVVYRP